MGVIEMQSTVGCFVCMCVILFVRQHQFQHDRSFLITNPTIDQATLTRRDLSCPDSTHGLFGHIHLCEWCWGIMVRRDHSSTSHSL